LVIPLLILAVAGAVIAPGAFSLIGLWLYERKVGAR
jgi:hypothetical protein